MNRLGLGVTHVIIVACYHPLPLPECYTLYLCFLVLPSLHPSTFIENVITLVKMCMTGNECSSTFLGTVEYILNYYTGSWSTARELIDNVACTGTESKLIDCHHNINLHNSYTSPRVVCRYCKH